MSDPEPNSPEPFTENEPEDDPIESLPNMSLDQWIETLHRADRSFYNMMALEVWSIAKTMDGLIPGFWNRFMTNRQTAVQQFMQQRRAQRGETPEEPPTPPPET